MISRDAGCASVNKGPCQRKQSLSPKQKGCSSVHVQSAQGQQHLKQMLHFMVLGVLWVPHAKSMTVSLFLIIFHGRMIRIMTELYRILGRWHICYIISSIVYLLWPWHENIQDCSVYSLTIQSIEDAFQTSAAIRESRCKNFPNKNLCNSRWVHARTSEIHIAKVHRKAYKDRKQ